MAVKTYDFIIGYENKVREIDSVYLLKYELERRGYSVLVFQEFDQRYDDVMDVIYHAKTLVVSCGYADKYVEAFVRRFISFDRLVNWQWEQVFSKDLEEDPDSFINIHGNLCRQAVILSWGDYNVQRMTKLLGLPEDNVIKTGIMSMDFLHPQFSQFYKSRDEVLQEYGINPKYKVAILLGVFQTAFATEEELDRIKHDTGVDYHVIARDNRKRFDIEMDWILNALLENEDLYFIYRPHPGDEYDRCPKDVQEKLDYIKERTNRFIVNQDYTVRQWFNVADKVYTGFSTTMVDAYFAKASCRLLSPAGIAISDEHVLFEGAKETATYDDFVKSLNDDDFVNPLREQVIDGYYSIGDELRYPVVADALEHVLSNDKYIIDTSDLRNRVTKERNDLLKDKSLFKKIKLLLWKYDWFYALYWKIMSLPVPLGYFHRQQEYKSRIDQYYKSYVASAEEIAEIENRIKRCVENR